ncbi:ATP-dependent DNA helicase RecQ-like [Ostrea edulis]|uniref:ATP-dependent DNA helicase RecQ-like n=1 Tax=Ostrea edulis TaxID=37623 RepID=UPI0020946A06|nr:ATP-dependent DNA helicase RecQ-like [Ostrea edulis]XP_056022463.1 ATP-dependent DNA helicase RecQ-like [Ostrea edulis]
MIFGKQSSMEAPLLTKVGEVFEVEKLSAQQEKAISSLLDNRDVFLSLRTGGGKSLCYMAFPLFYERMYQPQLAHVLIVSPLLAIMKEQTEFLKSKGFTATYIGKDANEDDGILAGEYQFLFTSPEAVLQNDKWRNMLSSSKSFRLFVVDEAHTVVHWGESTMHIQAFREWFSRTGEIRSLISCPALVITATASKEARKLIRKRLALNNCVDIIDSPDRENIKLFLEKIKNTVPIEVTFGWLLKDLSLEKKDCTRTLVFCSSIKTCADIYTAFLMVLDKSVMEYVNMFHSCTSETVKEKIRQDMNDENGTIRVLIATSAAGMGVNYKGINNVVHYGPPKDMDSFVQQLGRAGRDGCQALHLLIYNSRHTHKLDSDMKNYIENKDKCRRLQMLQSYDSLPNGKGIKHLCCDICSQKCDCEDKCCLQFQHPFHLYKTDDDSSDESFCMSDDTDFEFDDEDDDTFDIM